MEKNRLRSILESLLFISGEPLSLERIAQIVQGVEKKLIKETLEELAQEYMEKDRGLRIAEVAGGYQLESAKENAEYIARLIKTRPLRLTKPSLETLAIIAYRQPITRQEVDQIRGVDSSGVIKTLLEYEFIQIMGRKDVPGRPLIYGTTKRFLEFFRLKSLSDLPGLEEFYAQVESATAQEQNLFGSQYQEREGVDSQNLEPDSKETNEPNSPESGSEEPEK